MADNEEMMAPCRIKDGGTLTATGDGGSWCSTGYNSTGGHIIVEYGGTVDMNTHFWIGNKDGGVGTVDINGGTVLIADAISLGHTGTGVGYVNLNAGLLQARYIAVGADGTRKFGAGSLMDLRFGKFVLTGGEDNDRERIQLNIDNGRIVGWGGAGTVSVEENVDGNWTASSADPMERYPTWEDKIPNTGVTFSWKNLDPNNPADAVWVDVYYGTDPNNPNQWTKLSTAFPNQESVAVGDLPVADDYLWQINSYLYGQPIQYGGTKVYDNNDLNPDSFIDEGLMIPFATQADYMAPEVVIDSNDILTWNDYPVTLTATITDEGASPVDYVWSSDDPNITFSEMTPASPVTVTGGSATVTVKVTGVYQQPNSIIRIRATITVNDQTNPEHNSDTMSVYLAKDACSAARENAPGSGSAWPRLDLVYTADFDGDCDIDLADLLVVVRQWLDPYALENPIQIP